LDGCGSINVVPVLVPVSFPSTCIRLHLRSRILKAFAALRCTPSRAYGGSYPQSHRFESYRRHHSVMTVEHRIDLRCHPSTRSEAVRAIQVLVRRSASAELRMTFRLDGDISRIGVPPASVPRIATQLWQHTCFEAFIAVDGQAAYHEFNFAPSGEWAAYAFSGYRNGGPIANETMRPQIAVRSTGSRLELDARVRLDVLSAIHPQASLRIGLSAVIEANDGLSYWAIHHPTDKPDFHNLAGFALMLEPPAPEG
jgi:hypothetical protein